MTLGNICQALNFSLSRRPTRVRERLSLWFPFASSALTDYQQNLPQNGA
jgi:hypothetical protein